MSYFSSSNYEQYYDNNQFYPSYYNNNNDDYDTHESRYVPYSYSDHTQYYNNEFQLAPSQSLVGYYYSNNNNNDNYYELKNANLYENGDYYYDPVSTQFVISYNIAEKEVTDLDFEEYNPEPYHGGYDISETYGKSLPPSDDICYPFSKINPNLSLSLPYGKNDQKPETNLIGSGDNEDEDEDDEDYEEEDEDEDEENEDNDLGEQVIMQTLEGEKEENIYTKVDNGKNEKEGENRGNGEEYGKEVRRQITPGYGMEAIDICEGLFGGYFPCLLKKNKGGSCKQCGGGSQVKLRNMDEYECWQGTVDYLFGNPNPYGGSMPEKGSYGDPMYCYQRYYPQGDIVGEVMKYEENENSSWLFNHYSRYN